MFLVKTRLSVFFTFIFIFSSLGEVQKESSEQSDQVTASGVFKVSLRRITLKSGKELRDMSGKFIFDSGKELPVFISSPSLYFPLLRSNKKSIKAEVSWKKTYKAINDASLIKITLKE